MRILSLLIIVTELLCGQMYYRASALHNHQRVPTRGLMAYYNAGSLSYADSASVTSWASTFGSQIAAAGTSPSFVLAGQGGRPSVSFTAASSQYLTAGNVNPLSAATQMTMFAVAGSRTSLPDWQGLFGKDSSYMFGSTYNSTAWSMTGKTTFSSQKSNGVTVNWWSSSMPVRLQIAEYITRSSGGSDHYWYFNSGWLSDTAHNSTNNYAPAASSSDFKLGTQSTSYFQGRLSVAGLYNTILTVGERERIVRANCSQFVLLCAPTAIEPDRVTGPHATATIALPNVYDKGTGATGTQEIVQPDVIYFPSGWNGYSWWMALTGYSTHSYDTSERNDVLASTDGASGNWTVMKQNLCDYAQGNAYNDADPGFYFDSGASRLYIFSNHTYANGVNGCAAGAGKNCESVSYQSSTDGTTWACSANLITATTTSSQLSTPNVIYNADLSRYEMYTANRELGVVDVRYSSSLTSGWGSPIHGTIIQNGSIANAALLPYHISVKRENGVYFSQFFNYSNNKLYFATSLDGLTWYVQHFAMFNNSASAADASGYYKGALVRVTPSQWEMFYTCIAGTSWRACRTTITGL